MLRTDLTMKHKSSTPGDSTKAPQIGATGRKYISLKYRVSSANGDSVNGSFLGHHLWGQLGGTLCSQEYVRLL
jgi:hypothetical protein